ncbi:hypothetical protein [Pseudoduganella chitinolytica]|uniref:Uncharacterized protein n=1 Tax=Pseudoduganella chitinolytica TaxID=34070 RepID=A0ABY8BFX0_9BURK|nr:hypothetical protein [Pseudoduganella chitinolytica]WEF34799.1 hypothetical protein PX653_08570 [Pseudoduganella chitinolytica]
MARPPADVRRRPVAPRRQRGAALLLLLAVASVGFAAVLLGAFAGTDVERQREQRTLARLALASDALVGFAALNGRLPRPAISATDGREASEPCADEAACSGFLPWVTLAVEGADSWGKRLRYSVTPLYTSAPIQRLGAVATKRVQTRDGNGELRYVVGQETCMLAADCAPAVVYSQGRANLGTSVAGLAQANGVAGNIDEIANDGATTTFVRRPASVDPRAPGGQFDDLLVALPLAALYDRMAAARTLP